ncbi:MAG: baseplate J/gp47 family protein [Defluviitaleaceae bacterium]|nr:baseplate J/gp47 family protein [Defluviitaleaceae bacterium]
MYEGETYPAIMKRVLARVANDVDKRQGSVIWDAAGPTSAEHAKMYIEADNILDITFADTAFGIWLDKRCAEMGVHREPATSAIRLGLFWRGTGANREPFDVPIGSRFSLETLNFAVTKRLVAGQFELTCEEAGIAGNQLFGRLIPIQPVSGLSAGELADVLIPGEDEEKDERLYERYEEAVNTTPYGGNIDDYRQKVRKIDGVYDSKIFPVWNGGGTVKVCFITTELGPPSTTFVAAVQEILDPEPYHQQGNGLAPIGHWVTVTGVAGVPIDFSAALVLKDGMTTGQVQPDIEAAITGYFKELAEIWAEQGYEGITIVRASQIEARILNIPGIVDITGITLNGAAGNITLGAEEIPVLGSVALSG